LGPRVARHVCLLWEFGGEFFDFDEQRPGVVNVDAVGEEDDSACAGHGEEHPGVDGEAEDCGLRHRCAMGDQRGFDGEFEGADGSRGAGDQVGEICKRDCEPGGDAIDRQAEEKDSGGEDHAFAGPDDDGLNKKKKRAGNTEAAGSVEGEGDPVLDLREFWIDGQTGEEALDRRLQAASCDQKDEKADGGDGEGDIRDETKMRGSDAAYGADKHQDEDEDVEELFEDHGAEDDGGRGVEVAGIGEDAHDVADAQGKDVVGGERGHEDPGADTEVSTEGTLTAGHHLAPADAAKGVTGEGEAEDAENPCGMRYAQGEDMGEGDSAEGVPEEKGADEQAGDGLHQVAVAAGFGCGGHAGNQPSEQGWGVAMRW
jgi:hypothetical protein